MTCRTFRGIDGACSEHRPVCPPDSTLKKTALYQAECVCDMPWKTLTGNGCQDCAENCAKCDNSGCVECEYTYFLKRSQTNSGTTNSTCVGTCKSNDGLSCDTCAEISLQAQRETAISRVSRISSRGEPVIVSAIKNKNFLALRALMCQKTEKVASVLYWAADSCDFKMIRAVVSFKYADKKYQDKSSGYTPLHIAAEKCDDGRIFELLMKYRRKIEEKNSVSNFETYILFYRIFSLFSQVSPAKRDHNRKTALMTAIHVDNEIAFNKILPVYTQHQLNMRQDTTKRSALHSAAIKCNKKMFDALLIAGANQQARDASQRTPLDYRGAYK